VNIGGGGGRGCCRIQVRANTAKLMNAGFRQGVRSDLNTWDVHQRWSWGCEQSGWCWQVAFWVWWAGIR